jgi:glycosyltransferase involved in cell wall biosynthesis
MEIKNIIVRLASKAKRVKGAGRVNSYVKKAARRLRIKRAHRTDGVNLVAYIRAEMGLGTAARGIARALEAVSIPFDILNFETGNPASHKDTTWVYKEVSRSNHAITILGVNPDNIVNASALLQEKELSDTYTIGYWFWELPEIPDEWLMAFRHVDEVWAASRFVQDAIALKSPVPVFRVPVPIQLNMTQGYTRTSFELPERSFLFFSMGDSHSILERKNPLGAVRAFKKSFDKDDRRVGLVLKLSNSYSQEKEVAALREEISDYPNIYMMDRVLRREEINALLSLTDCYLSLHRSEGFGLGPAEAMSLGKPAILTNWSGNTDYMRPHNSIGIDYQLVKLGRTYGPYQPEQQWAEPDIEQAAYWMKKLTQDLELARRIGRQARETMANEFSPEAVGRLINQRLTYIRQLAAPRTARP